MMTVIMLYRYYYINKLQYYYIDIALNTSSDDLEKAGVFHAVDKMRKEIVKKRDECIMLVLRKRVLQRVYIINTESRSFEIYRTIVLSSDDDKSKTNLNCIKVLAVHVGIK